MGRHAPEAKRALMRRGERVDPLVQLAVLRDERPARRGELREREPPPEPGKALEEALDREQPLLDALRVVEAVHADAEERVGGEPELLEHRAAALRDGRRGGGPAVRPLDRDRVRPDERLAPPEHDRGALPVDPRLEEAVHRLEEVVAVLLRVEPDDARPEHPLEQLALPRADAEPLRARPRDVPEGDDRRARQALADHPGREGEVVVLHEHDRVRAPRPPRRPPPRTGG